MLSTSADYKTAIASADREVRGYIKWNNDSTKLMRGCDGLISIVHHGELVDQERPMFNCACSSYCEIEFFNSALVGVSLATSYFDAYIGVFLEDTGVAPVGSIEPDTATIEYVHLGRFFVSSIQRGSFKTSVTAYDEFAKLNREYVPTVSKGDNGYAIKDILTDIRTQCGFLATTVSADMGYVDELYSGTCRQMMGWIVNMSPNRYGTNVMMYRPDGGETSFVTTHLSSAWSSRDSASHLINDDTLYMDGVDTNETFTVTSVTTGTEANPITIGSGMGIVGENPYMTQALATSVYNGVNGIYFNAGRLQFRGNPAIVLGDVMKVSYRGDEFYFYVQRFTTTFNGGLQQELECFGDSEFHYEMSTYPTESKINKVSDTVREMQERIENGSHGIITDIYDSDGYRTEMVISDSMDLASATSVWRFNVNGFGHSTSYSGGTYNILLDDQGRLNASMILTGIIADTANKNSWNLDTGAFTITDGSVNITTSSGTDDRISLSFTSGNTTYTNTIAPYNTTVSNGARSSILSWDGIYYRQLPSNNDFFMADNTGITLKNYSAVTTVRLNNTSGSLKLTDGSTGSVEITNTGIVFKDSNSNTLNTYPSTGLPSTMKSQLVNATITSQYFYIDDAAVTATSQVFVTPCYTSASWLTLICTAQAQAGRVNVYVRKADGTAIPDNTALDFYVMIVY